MWVCDSLLVKKMLPSLARLPPTGGGAGGAGGGQSHQQLRADYKKATEEAEALKPERDRLFAVFREVHMRARAMLDTMADAYRRMDSARLKRLEAEYQVLMVEHDAKRAAAGQADVPYKEAKKRQAELREKMEQLGILYHALEPMATSSPPPELPATGMSDALLPQALEKAYTEARSLRARRKHLDDMSAAALQRYMDYMQSLDGTQTDYEAKMDALQAEWHAAKERWNEANNAVNDATQRVVELRLELLRRGLPES